MAFQASSINAATAATGYAISFSPAASFVTLKATAEFWIKPTLSSAPAVPTNPVATGLVAGWYKMSAGDTLQLGLDGTLWQFPAPPTGGQGSSQTNAIGTNQMVVSPFGSGNTPDTVGGLQVWSVGTGDLKVLAH